MPISVVPYNAQMELGPTIYLDANILISSRLRGHQNWAAASTLLLELVRRGIRMCLSTLSFDEIWWGLLREWYHRDTGNTFSAFLVKQNHLVLQQYSDRFRYATRAILGLPNLLVVPNDELIALNSVRQALRFLTGAYLLPPRDSFHLALIRQLSIDSFATLDSDFDRLDGMRGMRLTIVKP